MPVTTICFVSSVVSSSPFSVSISKFSLVSTLTSTSPPVPADEGLRVVSVVMRPEVSTDTSLAMGDTTAFLGEKVVVVVVVVELVGVNSAVTSASSFLPSPSMIFLPAAGS